MSVLIQSDVGWFRGVTRNGNDDWLLECPGCAALLPLSEDQWLGRVSVNHAADNTMCNYHETHQFRNALYNQTKYGLLPCALVHESKWLASAPCIVRGTHNIHRDMVGDKWTQSGD